MGESRVILRALWVYYVHYCDSRRGVESHLMFVFSSERHFE
jgi:hypothetical protein